MNSSEKLARVERLAMHQLAGDLSAADWAELEHLVLSNDEAKHAYVNYIRDTAQLRWLNEDNEQSDVGRAPRDIREDDNQMDSGRGASPTPRRKSLLQRASRHPQGPAIAIAVAVMLMVVGAMAITPVGEWIAGNGGNSEGTEGDVEAAERSEHVAILHSWQKDVWLDNSRPPLNNPRLNIGQRLVLESGLIELKYNTGARVVIEGPAEFVVGGRQEAGGGSQSGKPKSESGETARSSSPDSSLANSGFLRLGSLVARVEGNEAQGFTIETPSARFEDFGTEFGIEVGDDGASEVVVLSGEVDVASGEEPKQRVRLVQDQGAYVAASGGITRRSTVDTRLVTAMQARLDLIQEAASTSAPTVTGRSPVYTITDDNTGHEWLVIDNELAEEGEGRVSRLGKWDRNVLGANTFNHIGFRAQATATPGTPTAKTAWAFLQLEPGTYEVAVNWAVRAGQPKDAPFSINGGPAIFVDQAVTPAGPPNLLESSGEDVIGYQIISTDTKVGRAGTLTVALTNDANGRVLADSVAIRRVNETKSTANERRKDTNQSSDTVSGDIEK